VRQNLHSVQLAIERYASDNEGVYPRYLLGGDWSDDFVIAEDYWRFSGLDQVEFPFWKGDKPKLALPGEGDWLVMEGYMPRYPRNPFYRKWRNKRCVIVLSLGDTRNVGGDDSTSMFQVGADHRFENARFGERYWLWQRGNTIDRALRGNFYYKALIPPGDDKPRGYILMAFGKAKKPNLDAFTTVPGGHELDGRLPDGTGVGMGVPVIPELGLKPDGKRDGVILVLHGGWPWEEEPSKEPDWRHQSPDH